jgi:membrane protein DedA with SNARE-associated domain
MAIHRRREKGSLVWGLILIFIGFAFFLYNFDIDLWDYVWKFWPLILIIWGANKLYYGLREREKKPAEKKEDPAVQDRP